MRRVGSVLSLLLVATSALLLPGAFAPASGSGPATQIVDGEYVSSAPWAAALYIDGRVWCSGSIISSRWVLTAKHCTDGGGSMSVRVGNVRHANGTRASVSRRVHAANADLSLLRLDRGISTTYARLASNNPPTGSTNRIYGWGTLNNVDPTSPLSPRLKSATVRVLTNNARDYFGGPAIRSRGISGTTGWGDSGGPQMHNGVQVGVCSTGTNTDHTYASVAANRGWIRSITGV